MSAITIYTDGACHPNPGKGGFGGVIIWPADLQDIESEQGNKTYAAAEPEQTTNNRMETMAVIAGLKELERDAVFVHAQEYDIEIITDSMYVIYGMKSNGYSHKSRGGKEPLKNADLWDEYIKVAAPYCERLKWKWVKGHAGDKWNMKADMLASVAAGIYKDKEEWWEAEKMRSVCK